MSFVGCGKFRETINKQHPHDLLTKVRKDHEGMDWGEFNQDKGEIEQSSGNYRFYIENKFYNAAKQEIYSVNRKWIEYYYMKNPDVSLKQKKEMCKHILKVVKKYEIPKELFVKSMRDLLESS
jgi:hypothetical protein